MGTAESFFAELSAGFPDFVDPLPQEGGAQTAYQHTLYMADISVLQGPNRMPPPAPVGTSSSNAGGAYGP